MDEQIQRAIRKEIEHEVGFARANPLRYPSDPRQIERVIELALQNPDWGARELVNAYQRQNRDTLKIPVYPLLRRHRIAKRDGRESCSRAVRRHKDNLVTLIWTSDRQQAEKAFRDIELGRNQMRLSFPVASRMILMQIMDKLEHSNRDSEVALGRQLRQVLGLIALTSSDKLFRRIVRAVSDARGLSEPVSVDETITELIQQVDEAGTDEADGEAPEAERLAEENAFLRSTLFGLKHELVALQEKLRSAQETTQTQAIVSFLREMNSSTNNNLLDNIALSNRAIAQMLSTNSLPDSPEVEGVVYSLKMLLDYLLQIGVRPIQQVGHRAQVTMDDLTYILYVGTEFSDSKQTKWVQFRSPGWAYRDQVITRPQAVEMAQ
jgi:molecular chaperone GrpE (heat shock protein)